MLVAEIPESGLFGNMSTGCRSDDEAGRQLPCLECYLSARDGAGRGTGPDTARLVISMW